MPWPSVCVGGQKVKYLQAHSEQRAQQYRRESRQWSVMEWEAAKKFQSLKCTIMTRRVVYVTIPIQTFSFFFALIVILTQSTVLFSPLLSSSLIFSFIFLLDGDVILQVNKLLVKYQNDFMTLSCFTRPKGQIEFQILFLKLLTFFRSLDMHACMWEQQRFFNDITFFSLKKKLKDQWAGLSLDSKLVSLVSQIKYSFQYFFSSSFASHERNLKHEQLQLARTERIHIEINVFQFFDSCSQSLARHYS